MGKANKENGKPKILQLSYIFLEAFSNWAWEVFQVRWNNIHPCEYMY